MTLPITFASAHQQWRHVVAHQIHVQVEFASAAQVTHVVTPVKRVILELVSVELLLLVLGKQLDLIVMHQIISASVHHLLLCVVVPQIHVQVEFASAAQMMLVVIRVKRVVLDPVCVVLHRLVLGSLLEHIVMLPITFANAHQRWMHVLAERNVPEALVFVSIFDNRMLIILEILNA